MTAAGLVVALAVVWWLTAPDDIATPGGTIGLPAEPSGSVYVGYFPLSERDLVLESVDPVTPDGLDVALWRCHPVPGESPIGTARDEDLAEFCRTVEPFVEGAVVAGHGLGWGRADPYLLVEVSATSDQVQVLCALDITYRPVDGWRTGRQRNSGPYQVVVNEAASSDWPDDDPFSVCG